MSDEVKVEEKPNDTVVLNEPAEEKATESVAPTRDELKEKGWSAKELDAAEKRGMIQKKEEKPKVDKKETGKVDVENLAENKEDKTEEVKTEKPNGSLPDFSFKTPEQEKAWLEAFGPGTPQRAMYFRMKNERQARQAAEAERDRTSLKTTLLEDRIKQLESGKPAAELDENGNEIDPDDKPLTARMLREMKEKEQREAEEKDAHLTAQANRVATAMKEQEEYAKSILPDFDATVTLAKEVMLGIDDIPEKWKRDKIANLIKELQISSAYADKKGLDDYNAPMIAYEIGQMHPNWGKKADGNKAETDTNGTSDRPEKANGSLTPEQMKRIEKNTQRGASSASIPGGGGRRVVSAEDITIKDVLKMSPAERDSFRKKHPEKMAKLLRG